MSYEGVFRCLAPASSQFKQDRGAYIVERCPRTGVNTLRCCSNPQRSATEHFLRPKHAAEKLLVDFVQAFLVNEDRIRADTWQRDCFDFMTVQQVINLIQCEPPRLCRRPPSLALRRASGEHQIPIVSFLCLRRRHVPERAEQPMAVVPVHPFERGEFDILERTP